MLNRIRKNRGGFTLVEIMIVVAIIALLAAIAVPGFLRARKRSQATAILNDVRVLDNAKSQYATENALPGSTLSASIMCAPYIKPGSRMYSYCAQNVPVPDLLGRNYTCLTLDGTYKVDPATIAEYSDVIDSASAFWGSYGG
ncbi:MAG: prepilin-type N-terminal cleavage/methylation domain-containing protein [Verrucomicrobia bacterium]|nr:prepilin-type N-terminal cleavage/methylation domain-containing protein [Verrucomicrobiota bacterium]